MERRPTQNQAAYDYYQRAKLLEESLTPRSGRERFEQAIALYDRAASEDPDFALVYPRLTYVNGLMYWLECIDSSPARRALTQAARDTAERLAPNAPETHVARGNYAYFVDNDWNRALTEYRAAEADLPNDAQLLSGIGYAHRRLGHWQQAVDYLERVITLSPHDYYNGTQFAAYLLTLRRFERAVELGKRYDAWTPRDGYPQNIIIRVQFGVDGDRAALLRELRQRAPMTDDPDDLEASYDRAIRSGDYAAAERALVDPRLKSITIHAAGVNEPVALHRAYVAWLRGQPEAARQFSDEAIAMVRAKHPPPRQQPHDLMSIAQAEAYAGRADEAVRDARASAGRPNTT